MNTKKHNQIKVIFINRRQLLSILSGTTRITNIPDYTKIIDMREDMFVGGFKILIEHPSFSEIPEGLEPPMFDAICETNNKSNRKFHFD